VTSPITRLNVALASRYSIERELGQGGMATVYLAHDIKHDRKVAIKVLHPDLGHALGAERFQREIKLAARLQHPQILTVFDSGEAAEQLWYAMPFVEGETLRDRLNREKQLGVDEAVRITREVALALDYAHRQGVIHRDIKPENILLAEGRALLADFGIGQALGGEADVRLTSTGLAIGTAAYMSPEQASAERDLDGRTDIYSLAVVLYELLAGEPPFTGPTSGAILARALTERPRPIHPVRDAVSAGLDAVINKAMSVTRVDRYATGAEFAEALASPPDVASAPAGRRQWLIGAGTAAVVLIAAVGGALLWSRVRGGTGGHTRIAVLPFENLGDSADAYFVDGMTDAVRGKLTALTALDVIDRESMKGYRKTSKSPREIGRELEVAYLLTGTIRFSGSGSARQVQVNPELVQVATASTKWNRAIEAPLTDLFKVQGDIAAEVAGTLNVALGADDRRNLAERPTQSLPAYEAMLRGDKAWDYPSGAAAVPNLHTAIDFYHEAVVLDPRFAAAYARLSWAYVVLWQAGVTGTEFAIADSARMSAERAVALDPDGADGHRALAHYFAYIPPIDLTKSLDEYAKIRRQPAEKGVLLRGTGMAELRLGREIGLTRLREAVSINPRSVGAIRVLALQLVVHRQYADALAMTDRGLALNSTVQPIHMLKIIALLAQGDRAGASAAYAIAERQIAPTQLATLPSFPQFPIPLTWLLDGPQQVRWLASVQSGNASGTVGGFSDAIADYYRTLGDVPRARAYADSARAALEADVLKVPKDYMLQLSRGLMLALLDRKNEAVEQGTQAAARLRVAEDLFSGLVAQHLLARIHLLVGQPDQALDLLEPLLKNPTGWLTPAWLRIDPTWASLKGNPRFDRLAAGR